MPNPLTDRSNFQRALIEWFEGNGKDYPWRRTRDPYAVLVSEIMLQQTQIATVLDRGYFEAWMDRFPDVAALARATEEEVLKMWEGLGYYRRARNLQKAARFVVEELDEWFPESAEGIRVLPGVGRYTAGAVATFALEQAEPIVDANIARVLARLFDYREQIDSTRGQAQLWEWATALVPRREARAYNSGLMELGQTVCSPKSPKCGECPVRLRCAATKRNPEELPIKKPRRKTAFVDEHVRWVIRKDGRILLQKENQNRREGLWKLPALENEQAIDRLPVILKSNYSITHHRVTLFVHEESVSGATRPAPSDHEWFDWEGVDQLPMGSPYRKAVVALRESAPIFTWKSPS